MKKYISLVVAILLIISALQTGVVASASEIKIWHEDFESENTLDNYNITHADGNISIADNVADFGSNVLKISSGSSRSVLENSSLPSWTFNTNDNIVVSFDFMVTDQNTTFSIFGSSDYAHEGNSQQRHEYFCRTKYVDATSSYMLLRNPGSNETTADCYLGEVELNVKNNLTVVFIPRKSTYFAVSAIYLNGVKCSGVTNWKMSGIPASAMANMRFAAQTSNGVSDTYMDNIKISHYSSKTLEYIGGEILSDINPYNPIHLDFDNFILKPGTVTLADKEGNQIETELAANGKSLVITPCEHLKLNSEYSISFLGTENLFSSVISGDVTINTIEKRSNVDGKEFKNYELDEIKILIDKDIASDDLANISYISSGDDLPVGDAFTTNEDGNIYIVIPLVNNLKPDTEYKVCLSSIEGFEDYEDVTFRTCDGMYVSRPVITGVSEDNLLIPGTVTASVTLGDDVPAASMMLLYYKGTKLIGVSCKTLSDNSSEIFTSIDVDDIEDCYIKVYVVDNFNFMKPLTKCVTIGR